MADLAQLWGNDLALASTGDLATSDGIDQATQRIIRRLMTNPGDYMWHPDYGAGLPSFIGNAVQPATMISAIKSQLFLEASVARVPAPKITATIQPDLISVNIAYFAAETGAPMLLDFDVTPNG